MSQVIHNLSERYHMFIAWINSGLSTLWRWLRGDAPQAAAATSALPRAERKRRRKEIIAQAKAEKAK
jgi:hypothetical protein